jgi:hypothetical protein
MEVDNEIANLGVIDGALRLRTPSVVGCPVVRKNTDDIEFAEIGEVDTVDAIEFAPENQVKKLAGRFRRFPDLTTHAHDSRLKSAPFVDGPDQIGPDPPKRRRGFGASKRWTPQALV